MAQYILSDKELEALSRRRNGGCFSKIIKLIVKFILAIIIIIIILAICMN